MLTVSSMALAVLALAQAPYQTVETEDDYHVSRAFGKTYKSSVDPRVVFNTPPWNDEEESPPVSPRQAIKLAGKMCESVATAPDGWKWKAMNLNLFVGERYTYWSVMYQAVPIKPKGGPVEFHEITLIVLMDGTVIKPVVTDDKPRNDAEKPEDKS